MFKTKATGIVRRIDDLGRVVIPKEIRHTLRIREGDPLEIFVNRDGEVIFKKYSPIGDLGDFAKEYADSLAETIGHIALIADRDTIIAVAGAPKQEFLNKPIGSLLERSMEERKTLVYGKGDKPKGALIGDDDDDDVNPFSAMLISPIIAEGDPIGAVVLCSREPEARMGDLELKITDTAAGFLAKLMTAAEVAEHTERLYGRRLCWSCGLWAGTDRAVEARRKGGVRHVG